MESPTNDSRRLVVGRIESPDGLLLENGGQITLRFFQKDFQKFRVNFRNVRGGRFHPLWPGLQPQFQIQF